MIRVLLLILGIVLISQAGYVLWLTFAHRTRGDVAIAVTHGSVRIGAGLAALWAAGSRQFGAAWIMIGLLVADQVMRMALRRRRGLSRRGG